MLYLLHRMFKLYLLGVGFAEFGQVLTGYRGEILLSLGKNTLIFELS